VVHSFRRWPLQKQAFLIVSVGNYLEGPAHLPFRSIYSVVAVVPDSKTAVLYIDLLPKFFNNYFTEKNIFLDYLSFTEYTVF
jgi:hypothetical protein